MFTEAPREQLIEGAASWGLTLDPETVDKFARFAVLLESANRQLNLTRIRPEDYVTLHFLDSLSMAALCRPAPGTRLIDVGSGAGFPGIPLALAFPDLDVTLIDGTRKRLTFIDQVISALDLKQVRTHHARAETLAHDPKYRAQFDLVTARAVASMSPLAGLLLPLARPGGAVIAYKSQGSVAEIEAAHVQIQHEGGEIERVEEVLIPGTEIVRKLVLIRKRLH